jgi:Fe-S-cluster-containing dehydrogenase component
VAGTLALRAIFPDMFARTSPRSGSPDILAYLSRGDCFGEMALVLDAPRQATCIAYDHPVDDSKRKPGRVELVRIDGAAFKKLLDTSDTLRAKVDRLVADRYVEIVGGDLQAVGAADVSLTHSEEFQDAGLAQGQSLLLIDLDRCTRCGDCVRACQNTHEDGHSRLFLDGPTFDRFLIPSACRQCLNPACMIGCPVGAIQRGDNGQIEIRNWCIGCKLCAEQCPYDAIAIEKREDGRQANVCDQCTTVGDGTPMCVHACGPGAAQRVDGRKFFEEWGGSK